MPVLDAQNGPKSWKKNETLGRVEHIAGDTWGTRAPHVVFTVLAFLTLLVEL